MLKIKDLHTYYGNVHALKGVSLHVKPGEIVALIGSNGAGKSTLIDTVIGTVHSKQGQITFKDKNITNIASSAIVKAGISISPEGREVFPTLTVEENLRMGAYIVNDKNKISEGYARVYELFPRLKERMQQQAGTLSGGEQQMLAIGRALMNEPQLLLLDEPSLGLAPNIVLQIFDLIESINKQGTTILLVEQNANMALATSHRAYVLENGVVSMEGPSDEIANDPGVKKAYLGG
jgi:branched-chain amino acid transport system ATP-binding protein